MREDSYQVVDPKGLASYLQSRLEIDKTELARQLHDNLGGLIVAALMDAAWAQQNLPELSGLAQEKLHRVRHSLGAAIDLKRKLIEDLRPSLLDNFGLFAALAWHFKHYCASAQLTCSENFPPQEPHLKPGPAIALFRYVEETLRLVSMRKTAKFVALNVTVEGNDLLIDLTHDGSPMTDHEDTEFPEFASLKHRIWAIGGVLGVSVQPDGRVAFKTRIPLAQIEA